MRSAHRGPRFLLVLLVTVAPGALAQTSPFAGAWSGTYSGTYSETCTGGPPNLAGSVSAPWTGTVDAQGNFSLTLGTFTFSDGTTAPGSGPHPIGQVPANGALQVPPDTTSAGDANGSSTLTCPGYTFQFSLSPSAVNANYSCNLVSTFSGGGCNGTFQYAFHGTQTSSTGAPAPIFPITVTSNITPTTANATAQIQPPSQIVGTTGSVFVFAHARQSALGLPAAKGSIEPKDGPTPDPCVLAQLNSNGQLTAVSASTLQAYTTGVLTSQTQSVTILNNVSTPNVAGASFFVGYGANSGAMLSNGVYQGAVTVQGTSSCSAALLTGAAPDTPSALSGLWWNANESGWGIAFAQRRNIVFGAWYTYDSSGNPKWYVASNCALPTGVTGTSGTCAGSLYQVTGPAFFGTTFNPSLDVVSNVGSLTVNFQNANAATMSYTANGQSRSIPITRQAFQSGTTPPAVDYTDLWWNPNESGWGMTITQQYGMMFLAWYVYDSAGRPVWYVAPACVVVGSACSGTAYRTTGPPLGPAFNSTAVQVFTAGTMSVSFTDANNATLSYTINGISGSKVITRQTF